MLLLKTFTTRNLHYSRGSTDGFVFQPNLSKNDEIRVFNRDLCRSIPLKFSEEFVDPNGIPGYR